MINKMMLIRDMALFFFSANGAFKCKWLKELSEGRQLQLVIREMGRNIIINVDKPKYRLKRQFRRTQIRVWFVKHQSFLLPNPRTIPESSQKILLL